MDLAESGKGRGVNQGSGRKTYEGKGVVYISLKPLE